jgi:preprotein translocase subunit SecD
VEITLGLDLSQVPDAERAEAGPQVVKIINDRLAAFGVRWASAVQDGPDRVLVRVVGATDPTKIASLFGTGRPVEFRRVAVPEEYRALISELEASVAGAPTSSENQGVTKAPLEMIGIDESLPSGHIDLIVDQGNEATVRAFLESPDGLVLLPQGRQLVWGFGNETGPAGTPIRRLYLLWDEAEINGADIAEVSVRPGLDANWREVRLDLTPRGRERLSVLTAAAIGERLAILSSSQVVTAPIVRDRITNGSVSVSGQFTDAEAQDLAVVFRAGAIPAPVAVLSSRVLEPQPGRG